MQFPCCFLSILIIFHCKNLTEFDKSVFNVLKTCLVFQISAQFQYIDVLVADISVINISVCFIFKEENDLRLNIHGEKY